MFVSLVLLGYTIGMSEKKIEGASNGHGARKFSVKQIRYLWAIGYLKSSPHYKGPQTAKKALSTGKRQDRAVAGEGKRYKGPKEEKSVTNTETPPKVAKTPKSKQNNVSRPDPMKTAESVIESAAGKKGLNFVQLGEAASKAGDHQKAQEHFERAKFTAQSLASKTEKDALNELITPGLEKAKGGQMSQQTKERAKSPSQKESSSTGKQLESSALDKIQKDADAYSMGGKSDSASAGSNRDIVEAVDLIKKGEYSKAQKKLKQVAEDLSDSDASDDYAISLVNQANKRVESLLSHLKAVMPKTKK